MEYLKPSLFPILADCNTLIAANEAYIVANTTQTIKNPLIKKIIISQSVITSTCIPCYYHIVHTI